MREEMDFRCFELAKQVSPFEFVVYGALRRKFDREADFLAQQLESVDPRDEDTDYVRMLRRRSRGERFVVMTSAEIAHEANVSLPSVSRALKSLVARGWIRRERPNIMAAYTILGDRTRWFCDGYGTVVRLKRAVGEDD